MKPTTAISKIKSEFSLQSATNFGSVKIFVAFLEKIKLTNAMRSLYVGKGRNSLFRSPFPGRMLNQEIIID